MITTTNRVLSAQNVADLDAYRDLGGGTALETARSRSAEDIVAIIENAGLRGRGGAGFPTARKLRTVIANRSTEFTTSVVVNAAEGEPGSFKDRAILRANPFPALEGALIVAHLLEATEVIVATKAAFAREHAALESAIDELRQAGWFGDVHVHLFGGPSEYLYGEETALLEAIDGRPPFPRITPPYRRGVEEIVEEPGDVDANSASGAHVEMAYPEGEAPPTFASNTETYANVPGIISNGADWFRSVGTEQSPGTIVCTISGDVRHAGVAEIPMGTPLRAAIQEIGGGPLEGRTLRAALSGAANPVLLEADFDVPLSYEGMQAIGAGLGSAGFIVYDDTVDLVGIAAGVARFLAVESCGQCAACKHDGLAIATEVAMLAASRSNDDNAMRLTQHLDTVTDGARCNLATQQQVVVRSLLDAAPEAAQHRGQHIAGVEPRPMAPLLDIADGVATIDEHQTRKQPDWTFDAEDSGKWPADRLDDHRAHDTL
jgi:NADH-quinone oxidoreductase subunit F